MTLMPTMHAESARPELAPRGGPKPAGVASRLPLRPRPPAPVAPPASLPHYAEVDQLIEDLRPSEPVFCLRPAELRRLAARFASFPGRALYAVKCNPHPCVLQTLYEAGVRDFDVASLEEIALVDRLFGKAAGIFFNNPAPPPARPTRPAACATTPSTTRARSRRSSQRRAGRTTC